MRVLVTGAGGQVGRALKDTLPADIEAVFTSHTDFDIADEATVSRYVAMIKPDVIVNAAAYTAVDKAESDEPNATRINSHAPRYLAQAASQLRDTRLIHISTDFVFDGLAGMPYEPDSPIAPVNVYGRTKAEGEAAVRHVLKDRSVVVRTSWVYSAAGNNFFRTMLRLFDERGQVSVVDDQVGTPTSAVSLAAVLWKFAARPDVSETFHWTDAGVASWYDFAVAIAEEASSAGLLTKKVEVKPIPSSAFVTPARRPSFSVMNKRSTMESLALVPVHWRSQLRQVIKGMAHA